MRRWFRPIAILLVMLLFTTTAMAKEAEFEREDKLTGGLGQSFAAAAKEFDVPVELLIAVAYGETRLNDHDGVPSVANGYGVMHLVDNPKVKTLQEAAKLTKTGVHQLRTDTAANIRGGAALLAEYARANNDGNLPANLGGWFEAVAQYSQLEDWGARQYAEQVYTFLNKGLDATVGEESIHLEPRAVAPSMGRYEGMAAIQSTDYGPAIWDPANSGNYTVASRETDYDIKYVIIHVTQGSYAGAISWFKNASSNVSSHYVVRSSDGQVTQMVREKDVAYHAGNWTYNTQSIGIEHEGYVTNCTWFTDAMYQASAGITRSVAAKYNIPKTRSNIIGHNEVPGATHTDPGACWDWTYYMSLVNQTTGTEIIVDNATAGRFRASANWAVSTYSSQRYGSSYMYATPVAASDSAYYKVNIPSTRNYEIYMWYPDDVGYNASTPVVIWKANAAGTGRETVTVTVNQQANGGRWVSLGTYRLLAGDAEIVAVSRWTAGSGYVIADAFKFVPR